MTARFWAWMADNWANAVTACATVATAVLMGIEMRRRRSGEFPVPDVTIKEHSRPGWVRAEIAISNFLLYPLHWIDVSLQTPRSGGIYVEHEAFAKSDDGYGNDRGKWAAEEIRKPVAVVNAKIASYGSEPKRTAVIMLAEGDRARRTFYIWSGSSKPRRVKVRMVVTCERRTQAVLKHKIAITRTITLSNAKSAEPK